jgi:DNA-binding transcriptional LysR family regulator
MRESLSGLTALLSVAEKHSFAGAAAELGVTPSAVSQTVRALEERVGVRLLQRTTRNVGLTEAGARFIARLRPALDEVQAAFDSLGELRDRPAGSLRLTMPRFAFTNVLEPRLAAFLDRYPEIKVEMYVGDEPVDLVQQGFDAGVQLGEAIGREMVAVRITEDQRMAVVGSPDYFARHGRPKHPRDLSAHDCINYRQSPSSAVYRWEFSEHGKDFEVAVEGRFLVNDRGLMAGAAADGVGLAYIAEARVRDLIAQKRLIRVLDAWCPPFPGLFLYYPSRANIAPKLQALVDFLKKRGSGKRSR